jgi:hypothetical protein
VSFTMLLVLASIGILGSESHRSHDQILLSQIRDPPTWRARYPYLCLSGTGWPNYTPWHRVPSLSLCMTRRAMVEVFDPAFMLANSSLLGYIGPLYITPRWSTSSSNSFTVLCVFVAMETCLTRCYVVMDASVMLL